jgi:hypothetical protein
MRVDALVAASMRAFASMSSRSSRSNPSDGAQLGQTREVEAKREQAAQESPRVHVVVAAAIGEGHQAGFGSSASSS